MPSTPASAIVAANSAIFNQLHDIDQFFELEAELKKLSLEKKERTLTTQEVELIETMRHNSLLGCYWLRMKHMQKAWNKFQIANNPSKREYIAPDVHKYLGREKVMEEIRNFSNFREENLLSETIYRIFERIKAWPVIETAWQEQVAKGKKNGEAFQEEDFQKFLEALARQFESGASNFIILRNLVLWADGLLGGPIKSTPAQIVEIKQDRQKMIYGALENSMLAYHDILATQSLGVRAISASDYSCAIGTIEQLTDAFTAVALSLLASIETRPQHMSLEQLLLHYAFDRVPYEFVEPDTARPKPLLLAIFARARSQMVIPTKKCNVFAAKIGAPPLDDTKSPDGGPSVRDEVNFFHNMPCELTDSGGEYHARFSNLGKHGQYFNRVQVPIEPSAQAMIQKMAECSGLRPRFIAILIHLVNGGYASLLEMWEGLEESSDSEDTEKIAYQQLLSDWGSTQQILIRLCDSLSQLELYIHEKLLCSTTTIQAGVESRESLRKQIFEVVVMQKSLIDIIYHNLQAAAAEDTEQFLSKLMHLNSSLFHLCLPQLTTNFATIDMSKLLLIAAQCNHQTLFRQVLTCLTTDMDAAVRSTSLSSTLYEFIKNKISPFFIALLLDQGADANGIGVNRPLAKAMVMYVKQKTAIEIGELLLSHGAQLNGVDETGLTALMHAVKRGLANCEGWLRNKGATLVDAWLAYRAYVTPQAQSFFHFKTHFYQLYQPLLQELCFNTSGAPKDEISRSYLLQYFNADEIDAILRELFMTMADFPLFSKFSGPENQTQDFSRMQSLIKKQLLPLPLLNVLAHIEQCLGCSIAAEDVDVNTQQIFSIVLSFLIHCVKRAWFSREIRGPNSFVFWPPTDFAIQWKQVREGLRQLTAADFLKIRQHLSVFAVQTQDKDLWATVVSQRCQESDHATFPEDKDEQEKKSVPTALSDTQKPSDLIPNSEMLDCHGGQQNLLMHILLNHGNYMGSGSNRDFFIYIASFYPISSLQQVSLDAAGAPCNILTGVIQACVQGLVAEGRCFTIIQSLITRFHLTLPQGSGVTLPNSFLEYVLNSTCKEFCKDSKEETTLCTILIQANCATATQLLQTLMQLKEKRRELPYDLHLLALLQQDHTCIPLQKLSETFGHTTLFCVIRLYFLFNHNGPVTPLWNTLFDYLVHGEYTNQSDAFLPLFDQGFIQTITPKPRVIDANNWVGKLVLAIAEGPDTYVQGLLQAALLYAEYAAPGSLPNHKILNYLLVAEKLFCLLQILLLDSNKSLLDPALQEKMLFHLKEFMGNVQQLVAKIDPGIKKCFDTTNTVYRVMANAAAAWCVYKEMPEMAEKEKSQQIIWFLRHLLSSNYISFDLLMELSTRQLSQLVAYDPSFVQHPVTRDSLIFSTDPQEVKLFAIFELLTPRQFQAVKKTERGSFTRELLDVLHTGLVTPTIELGRQHDKGPSLVTRGFSRRNEFQWIPSKESIQAIAVYLFCHFVFDNPLFSLINQKIFQPLLQLIDKLNTEEAALKAESLTMRRVQLNGQLQTIRDCRSLCQTLMQQIVSVFTKFIFQFIATQILKKTEQDYPDQSGPNWFRAVSHAAPLIVANIKIWQDITRVVDAKAESGGESEADFLAQLNLTKLAESVHELLSTVVTENTNRGSVHRSPKHELAMTRSVLTTLYTPARLVTAELPEHQRNPELLQTLRDGMKHLKSFSRAVHIEDSLLDSYSC